MAQISSIKNASFPVNGKWRARAEKGHGNGQSSGDEQGYNSFYAIFHRDQEALGHIYDIHCKWEELREQILLQWPLLARREVDEIGPNRGYLAALIGIRYHIDHRIISNYLANMERHLPLM